MKKMKRDRCRFLRIWLAALWVTSCILAASPHVFAGQPPKPLSDGSMKERKLLTIADKSPDYNYIFIKDRRFQVSTSAVMLDHRGRKISLKDLLVPCKAYVTYQIFGDARDPMVHEIQLR